MGHITYCSKCQSRGQYPTGANCASHNSIGSVSKCASQELITDDLPNEMISILKQIHDFGDHDSVARVPDVSSLTTQNQYDIISFSNYEKLVNSISASPAANSANTIIGTYYQSLKEDINNYQIPSTRYYEACDYSGQCCDNDCDHCCKQICEGGDCGGCFVSWMECSIHGVQ